MTIYDVEDNVAGMFRDAALCRQSGTSSSRRRSCAAPAGTRLRVQPEFDRGIESVAALLRSVFNRVVRSLSGASARRAVCHRGLTWIRGVFIQDTFAEAFGMRAARLVITARTQMGARRRR